MSNLPYFDYCLNSLKSKDADVEKVFGRHVHWGYWEDPKQAKLTVDDFAIASENLSLFLVNRAEVVNEQAVLDVGCGFGGTIASINERFTGMRLTGLNIDERQLDRARQQVLAAPGNTIDFQQGDACALPFPDQSFDVVLAVECIFHFPDRDIFFREAQRVLKPGGTLAISDFMVHPYIAIGLPRKLNTGFFGVCDANFSFYKYRKLAAKHGLDVTFEKNITQNTLPTYRTLNSTIFGKKSTNFLKLYGWLTTAFLEIVTRFNLLRYSILAFQKQGQTAFR